MKCQYFVVVDDLRRSEECVEVVHNWRQCGRGCREVRAYCEAHGGMDRATAEMVEHMATHAEAA